MTFRLRPSLLCAGLLLLLAQSAAAASVPVTVAWDATHEAIVTGYRVQYGEQSGIYTVQIDAGLTTTVTVPNLLDTKVYYFVVQAYTADGTLSAPSSEVHTVVGPPGAAGPARFITVPAADGHLSDRTLAWTPVADAQAYYLYVGTAAGLKDVVDTHETQATSATLPALSVVPTFVARLWTKQNNVWRFVDMPFQAATVVANVALTPAGFDVNGDGHTDVLLQDSSSTWVGAWLMDGAGHTASFQPIYSEKTGTWKVVGTADLNGDGVVDILLQDSSSTWVAAWLMDAAGHTASFLPIYSDNIGAWKVVGTADLNKDGVVDIILQDSNSTWVGAWLMDGAGHTVSFQPIYSANVGTWKSVGTGDLNGDGLVDIVLQDSSSTWVGAWLMDGAGHPASFLAIYSANIGTWKIVGTADLNGDGIVDIVLQDSSSTWVGAWLMDGAGHPVSFLPVYSANIGDWKVNGRK